MVPGLTQSPFLNIKRNYLNFMEQTLIWFDTSLIRILFTLLMEKEPLTQDQLISLTGLNRATVSDTLSKLTESTSKFLVFQTRKKGERKKYYHCPQDLSIYFQNLLQEGLELTKISSEQIPEYLYRMSLLKTQNFDTQSFKNFLEEYQRVTTYFHIAVTFFQENLGNYVTNPNLISKISEKDFNEDNFEVDEINLDYSVRSNDSLDMIKRDFLNNQASSQHSRIGKRKELVTMGLLFFIEGKPITQNYISKITGYSRSTVSITLSDLLKLNIIQSIKKPKDRKKYYVSRYTLIDNLLSTIRVMNQIFLKSRDIVENQFLLNIKNTEGDNKEKSKLEKFMIENIRFFDLFVDYTRSCNDIVNELLSKRALSKNKA